MANETPPIDAIPVHNWVMEIDPGDSGVTQLASPHFHKCSGVSKETGLLEVIDGTTNKVFVFTDAVMRTSDVVITRTRDGSQDDQSFAAYFDQLSGTGLKIPGITLTQWRLGRKVLELILSGVTFFKYELSDFDLDATSTRSEQSYTVRPDNWVDVHFPQ